MISSVGPIIKSGLRNQLSSKINNIKNQRPQLETFSNTSSSIHTTPTSNNPSPSNPTGSTSRVYPIRKQFIYESYLNLFTQHQVCLFFRHDSLTPKEWNTIRGELKKLKKTSNQSKIDNHQPSIELQVLRTRMISPVLKELLKNKKITREVYSSFLPHLHGTMASITQTEFNPSNLSRAIQIISKHSSIPSKSQFIQISSHKKSDPQIIIDRLPFVIGLIDQKAYTQKSKIEQLGKLPDLDTLRQQILGLIGSLGAQLVSTLDIARGKTLMRTIDGHRATLEQTAKSNDQNVVTS